MKMLMAVVPRSQAENVMEALIDGGHSVTFMESRGGMLRQSQLSLFLAVQDEEVKNAISIIRDHYQSEVEIATKRSEAAVSKQDSPLKVRLGGGVIFVWELENAEVWDIG